MSCPVLTAFSSDGDLEKLRKIVVLLGRVVGKRTRDTCFLPGNGLPSLYESGSRDQSPVIR